MGYYDTNIKFKVSNHARVRIKERLNIKATSDLEIDIEINEILNGLKPAFTAKNCEYYKIPNYIDTYAIISKDKLILTVSKMGPVKIKKLF